MSLLPSLPSALQTGHVYQQKCLLLFGVFARVNTHYKYMYIYIYIVCLFFVLEFDIETCCD